MKTTRRMILAGYLVLTGAVLNAATEVWGSQSSGDRITGTVTSILGTQSLTIDGHRYRIKPSSPAAGTLPKIAPGQTVKVQLDGPSASSSSQVINIIVPHR